MNPFIEKRVEILRRVLTEKSLDTFMVTVEENRCYLSGFSGEDTQFDESAGALFITEDQMLLATDSRYELQGKIEATSYTTFCYKEGVIKSLPEIAKLLGSGRIGFESKRVSHKQHTEMVQVIETVSAGVALVPTEDIVENIRVIKDETEIDKTRKALAIAESTFSDMARSLRPGISEKELAWLMERNMREAGAERVAFPTIVASGPNSALPHAVPTDRKIKEGEPILFDWGARLAGYCSDTSRTLVLGMPADPFRKVFETVMQAQQIAIAAIRPGVSTKHIDGIARRHIEDNGFKGRFGHALGHGTGLAIHESPRLSPLEESILEAGMLVTVEPGIYLPEWGGVRLENQIVVREGGAEVLNNLDIDIII